MKENGIDIEISNISEFLERISDIINKSSNKGYVFRGQSNYNWDVASSAARRIKNSAKSNEIPKISFLNYHNQLINSTFAKGFHKCGNSELSELEMVAELQHHGAATCLIDFTYNALIALYFACNDQFEDDGCVIVLNYLNPSKISIVDYKTGKNSLNFFLSDDEEKIWFWEPGLTNNRILRQHSVFIFGIPTLNESYINRIKINKQFKREILHDLKYIHNLSIETLFCDLPGYAIANSQDQQYLFWTDDEKLIFGLSNIQKNEYHMAILLLSQYIENNPHDKYAYFGRALSYSSIEQYENAISDYTTAISLDEEKNALLFFSRGLAYSKKSDFNLAIKDYSKAIKIDPQSKSSYSNRGRAYLELKKYEKCIQDSTKAIEIDPNYSYAISNRGNAYAEMKKFHEAIQDFSIVLKNDPENVLAYYNIAKAYQEINNDTESIHYYTKAIQIDRNFESAYYNRAISYSNIGSHTEAIHDYSKLLKIDPLNYSAYIGRGLEYSNLKKYTLSFKDFTQSISHFPHFFEGYYYRGILYKNTGQYKKAIEDLKIALKIIQEIEDKVIEKEILKILKEIDTFKNDL